MFATKGKEGNNKEQDSGTRILILTFGHCWNMAVTILSKMHMLIYKTINNKSVIFYREFSI